MVIKTPFFALSCLAIFLVIATPCVGKSSNDKYIEIEIVSHVLPDEDLTAEEEITALCMRAVIVRLRSESKYLEGEDGTLLKQCGQEPLINSNGVLQSISLTKAVYIDFTSSCFADEKRIIITQNGNDFHCVFGNHVGQVMEVLIRNDGSSEVVKIVPVFPGTPIRSIEHGFGNVIIVNGWNESKVYEINSNAERCKASECSLKEPERQDNTEFAKESATKEIELKTQKSQVTTAMISSYGSTPIVEDNKSNSEQHSAAWVVTVFIVIGIVIFVFICYILYTYKKRNEKNIQGKNIRLCESLLEATGPAANSNLIQQDKRKDYRTESKIHISL